MSQREYLLESDESFENAASLVSYLRGFSKDDKKSDEGFLPVMGPLKNLLVATPVHVYDLPELQEKYPVGFHTENTLMISSQMLDKIQFETKKGEMMFHKEKARVMFSSMLLDMVEDMYAVSFDDKQRKQIVNEIFRIDEVKKFATLPMQEARETFENILPRANFVSWKEVTQIAQENGIKKDYAEIMGTNTDSINTALFITPQVHNPDHLLNKLVTPVTHAEALKNIPDLNPSLEEFTSYYHQGLGVETRAYAIEVLNHKLDKIIKKAEKNNLTDDEIIENLKKSYIPFLVKVDDDVFVNSVQNITFNLFNNRPSVSQDQRKLNEKFMHELNNNMEVGSQSLKKALEEVTNYASYKYEVYQQHLKK